MVYMGPLGLDIHLRWVLKLSSSVLLLVLSRLHEILIGSLRHHHLVHCISLYLVCHLHRSTRKVLAILGFTVLVILSNGVRKLKMILVELLRLHVGIRRTDTYDSAILAWSISLNMVRLHPSHI